MKYAPRTCTHASFSLLSICVSPLRFLLTTLSYCCVAAALIRVPLASSAVLSCGYITGYLANLSDYDCECCNPYNFFLSVHTRGRFFRSKTDYIVIHAPDTDQHDRTAVPNAIITLLCHTVCRWRFMRKGLSNPPERPDRLRPRQKGELPHPTLDALFGLFDGRYPLDTVFR